MKIQKLSIQNLRNLRHVEFYPHEGINLFVGANASGKTTLMEAVWLLGTGRSFRSSSVSQLIGPDEKPLTISALIEKEGKQHRLGIEFSSRGRRILLNGAVLRRAADLARLLPVQLLHPGSFHLLTSGPSERRRFLDWYVFHVEPSFIDKWQVFRRLLKQRNAALRSVGQARQVWDEALITAAHTLHGCRQEAVEKYNSKILLYIDKLGLPGTVQSEYLPGWDTSQSYAEILKRTYPRDMKQGYTTQGPHRADLQVTVDGVPAQHRLSRGQQKLVVSAMILAQVELIRESTATNLVFLMDDLASELDSRYRETLFREIDDTGGQLFLTATDHELLPAAALERPHRLFHVEHGSCSEVV